MIFQPQGQRLHQSQIVVKNIADVKQIADRRYALQNTAVELFFKSNEDYKASLFLNFKTHRERDAFKERLCKQDAAREMAKTNKHSLKHWKRLADVATFQISNI